MIALVGLTREGRDAGFVEIDSLPRPPALNYSGFLIQCSPAPGGLIQWILEMRAGRGRVPIGGVIEPGDSFLYALAKSGVQLRPLLRARDITDGRCVPTTVLHRFRDATIEGHLLEAWLSERTAAGHDDAPEAEHVLSAVVAVGPTGGGVPTLARCLGLSRNTTYRLFEKLGLPTPAAALRRVRHEAVQMRVEIFGMDERVAREAAGWLSPQAYEKARYRRRRRGTNWGGE
jgi:AraC-like DNA-binding protein